MTVHPGPALVCFHNDVIPVGDPKCSVGNCKGVLIENVIRMADAVKEPEKPGPLGQVRDFQLRLKK